jgi:hypothetical protein
VLPFELVNASRHFALVVDEQAQCHAPSFQPALEFCESDFAIQRRIDEGL